MGAPESVSALEAVLMDRVLLQVRRKRSGPGVLELRPQDGQVTGQERSGAGHGGAPGQEGALGGPLAVMRSLAAERARTEARMVEVAKDVVADTGAGLLADKDLTSVEELSATARRKWRADAKSTAVAEIQVLLGTGIMNARRLVGLACATPRTQASVVEAMDRGEASLDQALRFWERCARLPEEDGADVAQALFGTDPATAATERLDPEGDLTSRPWHQAEYTAALEREALRREGQDAEAKREQRRRARAERDASLRAHDDGTATLTLRCPLTTGAAFYQRIDRASRTLRGAGDPRTLAQLRSDVSSALLLHGALPLPGHPQDQEHTTPADQQHHGQPTDQPDDRERDGQPTDQQPADQHPGHPDDQQHDDQRDGQHDDQRDGQREGEPCEGEPDGEHPADPGADDLVSPADLEQISRVLNATPAVQLQVVIPWDVLTGRPAGAEFCPAPCCRSGAPDRGTTVRDGPGHPPPAPEGPGPPPADPDRPREPAHGGGVPPRRRGSVGEILGMHRAFITPEHARVLAMAPGTTLARLLADHADGRLVERTIKTYRPDADMRRQVRAADLTSRAPGSRLPAELCDIDHEHPRSQDGPTAETNLNCKDRTTHRRKTKGWWRTAMAPNRDVTWTTLLGQRETTRCHDYLQYLDANVPADPGQAQAHTSRRTDREDRLDLACQALYAALVHRDPHAHLADDDDHHGATEHDPSLGGWIWVSHTNPDGIRRHGPPTDHPTVEDILGIPTDDTDDTDSTSSTSSTRGTRGTRSTRGTDATDGTGAANDRNDTGQAGRQTPWHQRAHDDDTPPF